MATTKPAKVKPVKFKPAKVLPRRGEAGQFVSKAKVSGKSDISQFFSVIKDSAFEIARKEVREIATVAANDVKRGIIYQTVPPMGGKKFDRSRRFDNPLHPFTLKEKAKRGWDSRILIASGYYVEHIGVQEEKKGKGYVYRVGFTVKKHPSGITMDKLGRILEYGARIEVTDKMRRYLAWRGLFLKKTTQFITIPARPHFGPTLVRLRRHLKRTAQWTSKRLTTELRKRLAL